MAWAGRDRWYIYAAVTMALLSSLCSIVPYFAFYRVVDAVAEGTCTAGFALEWAGIILAAAAVQTLIAKYYQPQSGRVTIGGQDIRDIPAEQVLERISLVDQDVFLFDDTIRDNIRHARPDATDEEIEAACREANCDVFIRRMEKGMTRQLERTVICSPAVSGRGFRLPAPF